MGPFPVTFLHRMHPEMDQNGPNIMCADPSPQSLGIRLNQGHSHFNSSYNTAAAILSAYRVSGTC